MWGTFWLIWGVICAVLYVGYGITWFIYYITEDLPEKRRRNCFQFYKTYRKEQSENENDDFGNNTDFER